MKVCRKCGVEKPRKEFGRHKRTRDRLRAECKLCNAREAQRYYRTLRQKEGEEPASNHRDVWPLEAIYHGLEDAERALVRRAAKAIRDVQAYQAKRPSRGQRKFSSDPAKPTPADELVRTGSWTRDCMLMSRALEYARRKGWFVQNLYARPDWQRWITKQSA